jgi:hypothetical protein
MKIRRLFQTSAVITFEKSSIDTNYTNAGSKVGKHPGRSLFRMKVCVLCTEFCVTVEYTSGI